MLSSGADRGRSAVGLHVPDSFGDSRISELLSFNLRDLWILAGVALVLRLVFLWLGAQTHSVADVSMWAADTRNTFFSIAQYWLNGDLVGEQKLLLGGPGYGLILAGFQLVFGDSLWPPLLLSLALGCLAPVVIYLLSMALLDRRSVAILAALFVCISETGISMSVSLLTDQPFYTLHALALLMFVVGLKSDRVGWFVSAGIMASVATYIRALGQVWPIVFTLMALAFCVLQPSKLRWRCFRRSLWTPVILLICVLAWSSVNYSKFGVFTFTSNGVRATWLYMATKAVGMNTPDRKPWEFLEEQGVIIDSLERLERGGEVSYRYSRDRLLELARTHPTWLVRSFFHNVKNNLQAPNYVLNRQVPQLKPVWDVYFRQARDHLNEWMFFGSLIALFMLYRDKNHTAWIILGMTFVVFTLMTGFTYNEGSRLQFPAEMAFSILLAYFFVRSREVVSAWLGSRFSKR